MKDLKVPTSDRHREFQIECLKNPEHAAAYILDRILTESGCAEIYAFVELLNELGLKLAIEMTHIKSIR